MRHLSTHGKRMAAESMYEKGKSFIGAALLLRQRRGYEYVVLHLLCQGMEITLKGLLLMKNYDDYEGKLKHPFGHNIRALAEAAIIEFDVQPMRPALEAELEMLSTLYSRNRLRYGTVYDVLVNPATISSDLALRRMHAVIRLANRHVFDGERVGRHSDLGNTDQTSPVEVR